MRRRKPDPGEKLEPLVPPEDPFLRWWWELDTQTQRDIKSAAEFGLSILVAITLTGLLMLGIAVLVTLTGGGC